MTRTTGTLSAIAILLTAALPVTAAAQLRDQPAARSAPAPRAAPAMTAPAMRAAPAPRMVAPRYSAPAVQQRLQAQPRHPQRLERAQRRQPPDAQVRRNAQRQLLAAPRADTRAQGSAAERRVERAQRLREQRELRALPPRQRAARREEIRRAREERAQQRRLTDTNARTNVQARRTRDGRLLVTPQAARQGRFAASFAAQERPRWNRLDRQRARWAWRYGRRAHFVAWYGPIFWPYAYADIFDYTFWPGGYDPGYWYYAYDDFVDGLFWGEYGPPDVYAYAAPSRSAPRPRYAAVQNLCNQPGSGITAWPFAEIERKVGLSDDQKRLLGDVRDAGQKATATFRESCPSENAFPLTPPGRLDSMTARLGATLEAVRTVRPALETFYASLSDEQKERFNDIGPKKSATSAEARAALPDEAKKCGEAKPGLTNLPIEQIGEAVNPDQAQQAELDKLGEATVKAVGILQAACPDEIPLTPPGRLEAMEKRLQAMIDAAGTVKPALESFYASLSDEQKARFNRLGRDLARTNG